MPKTGKSVQGGTINYSQWDHIEVSDDEDDTHPNIDTPSLFRWRHQARVEKMETAMTDKEKFEQRFKTHSEKYDACRKRVENVKGTLPADLKAEWENLRSEHEKLIAEEQEMQKKERSTPWNVDTLSKDKQSRSIINKAAFKDPREESEEDRLKRLKEFIEKNSKLVKQLGMLSKHEDTQKFYFEHPELVCEETANQLVIWCIDLAVEEKWALMEHVSQQAVQLNFILELSRTIQQDPRSCVGPFYTRFKIAYEASQTPVTGAAAPSPERQYWESYDDELKAFRERIRKRAKERIDEAVAKYEEEERQKRLGPGGLDPQEVMESLPAEMRDCFEKRDIPMLQQLLMKMNVEEAKQHMKRCVDSGLWVPGPTDMLNPNRPKDCRDGDEEDEEFDEPSAEPPHKSLEASATPNAITQASDSSSSTAAASSAPASTSSS